MRLTDWLYSKGTELAKDLPKHDQEMVQLGWDACQSYYASLIPEKVKEDCESVVWNILAVEDRINSKQCSRLSAQIPKALLSLMGGMEEQKK